MSIEALILGKLHEPARPRTSSSTGRHFVTAKVRAAVAGDDGLFINVIAFSESVGAALLALDAGDSLALAGTLKPGAWLDREGNARASADLVAAQVLTAYGLKKKRAAVAAAGDQPEPPAAVQPTTGPRDDGEGFSASTDDDWLNGGRA